MSRLHGLAFAAVVVACGGGSLESALPPPPIPPLPPAPPPPAPPAITDRDHDGIPDLDDRCPDDAGPADNQGCPLAAVAQPAATQPAAGDDPTVAQALFDDAKHLVALGRVAEACSKFEASYRTDPQLGTLLNLADCHERLGKTATAWTEFRSAVDIAKARADERRRYAVERVAGVETKLDRLTVVAPSPAPAGLQVTRDGTDITALLGVATPVDPGDHTIIARAPGVPTWQTTVRISGEAMTRTLTIGAPTR